MATCENCGNEYDTTFKIIAQDGEHVFDCFECAINALAPQCTHCQTKIIGHGVQVDDEVFCCASCARAEGRKMVTDRASLHQRPSQ